MLASVGTVEKKNFLTCFNSSGFDYSPECDGGDPYYSDPEENNRNRGRRSSYYSSEV